MIKRAICFLVASVCLYVYASEVSLEEARQFAQGWRNRAVKEARTINVNADEGRFHVFKFEGGGWAAVGSDDSESPVIAFSDSEDDLVESKDNPIWALVTEDVKWRKKNVSERNRVRGVSGRKIHKGWSWKRKKQNVHSVGGGSSSDVAGGSGIKSSLEDVRVEPLIQSTWDQSTVGSRMCYNYYTPKNYLCGCIATMMSQIMRYHEWPKGSVEAVERDCWVDGEETKLTMQGGLYYWDKMTLCPDNNTSEDSLKEIGKLCSDVGIACRMSYSTNGGWSNNNIMMESLVDIFGYSYARFFYLRNGYANNVENFLTVIKTNCDAGFPMGLDIYSSSYGGHAVIVDGYGYNADEFYMHINAGWGGSYNAWYCPPNDVLCGSYQTIRSIQYNLFPKGKGAIVSGRVCDAYGSPLKDAEVRLYTVSENTTNVVASVSTNEEGIYHWIKGDEIVATYHVSATWEDLSDNKTYVAYHEPITLYPPSTYTITSFEEDGYIYYDWPEDFKLGNVSDVDFTIQLDGSLPDGGPYKATVEGVKYTFSISNGKATIGTGEDSTSAIPTATSGVVVLPARLGGSPVTTIGSSAFYRCSSLTSITIPDSVTTIGAFAFQNCSSLASVTIPNSVTTIGSYAFYGCSSLEEVHIIDLAKWCAISFGSTDANPCYYAHHLYLNGEEIKNLVVPNSVTTIGLYAFYGCSSLASVTIPNSVTSIGSYAFYRCSSLTSITIPNSVTRIGDQAFGYSSLTTVYVTAGDGVRVKYLIEGSGFNVETLTFIELTGEESDAVLPEAADYTYDGTTFAHSGWFSNTGSGNENFTTAGMAIGPGGGKVSAVVDGRHAWAGVKLPEAFTLAMYADASMITGASSSSKAVLWSTGGKSSNRVMLLTDGANVILSAAGGNSVSLPLPTPGYHLYTATFSTSGIKLAIDDGKDGKLASSSGSYSAIQTGFQIGSVYQGLPSGYRKGIGLAVAKMVGYNQAFTDGQIALLAADYPVSTTATGVINYSVSGGKFYAGSITHTNGRLEIDRGTLMVPAGSTYSVPALRFGNNGSNGDADAFGLELDGTLVISGGQTTDGNGQSGVRADVVNNRGGILGGEWTGQGVYNIRGLLDASNSFVQLVHDAHTQTWNVENGGVLKVKAFEARSSQSKAQSTHVLNIKNGGKVVTTQGFTRGKLISDIENGGVLEIANTANVNMTGSDLSGIIGDGQFKISNASGSGYTLLPTDPAKFFADTLEFAADSEFYLTSNKGFTIGSFSGKGNLNTKYNNEARTLTIKQAKDTTWSGNIVADTYNRLTALRITSENDSILTLEGRNNQTTAIELLEGGRIKVVGDGMTITSGVEGMEVKCVDGVYSLYTPVTAPSIEGDDGAEVTGDAEAGFVVKPSAGTTEVVIAIPEGVAAEKVTIEVSTAVQSVKANGATIKVVKGAADITAFLDIPAAVDGVVNLGAAEVKEAIVKETMDTEKGAIIELSAENPTLTTTETKPGLTYTLVEGTTLESMTNGDSKIGDGTKWTPEIKVKGGASAFYSIKVTK